MERLPYPAYVNIILKPLTKEHSQELRGSFYSTKGRIDAAPEGYWGSKEEPWHKPVGILMIVMAYFTWFMGKAMGSGVRTRKSM